MDLNQIKKQADLAKKAVSELKKINSTFGLMMNEAIKNTPEDKKKDIENMSATCKRAINMANNGKTEEAKRLIDEMKTKWESK